LTKSYTCAALATLIGIVVFDQVIKNWAKTSFYEVGTRPVIPGFFHLTYVENTGAAFGLFQGRSMLLSAIVSIIILVMGYVLFSGKINEPFLILSLSLVLGGGIGNLIDRFQHGFVIDYLDFSALFGFPVFNLADIAVVTGTFCIIFYVLFLEKKQKLKQAQETVSCGCEDQDRQEPEPPEKSEE